MVGQRITFVVNVETQAYYFFSSRTAANDFLKGFLNYNHQPYWQGIFEEDQNPRDFQEKPRFYKTKIRESFWLMSYDYQWIVRNKFIPANQVKSEELESDVAAQLFAAAKLLLISLGHGEFWVTELSRAENMLVLQGAAIQNPEKIVDVHVTRSLQKTRLRFTFDLYETDSQTKELEENR